MQLVYRITNPRCFNFEDIKWLSYSVGLTMREIANQCRDGVRIGSYRFTSIYDKNCRIVIKNDKMLIQVRDGYILFVKRPLATSSKNEYEAYFLGSINGALDTLEHIAKRWVVACASKK